VSVKTFSASTNPDLALAVVKHNPEIFTDWIRVYVTKYRMRSDQDLIILYTTDSPDNPKKFFNYRSASALSSGLNYIEFTKPLPNTTYYFWATLDHYADNYDFDNNGYERCGGLFEPEPDCVSNTTYYFWATLDHYADNYDFDNNGYERCGSLFEPEPDCVSPYGYSEMVSITTGDPPPPPSATPSPVLPSSPPTGASAGQKMCRNCNGNGKCIRAPGNATYSVGLRFCNSGYVDCGTCNGSGSLLAFNKICPTCNGGKKVKCGVCNGTGIHSLCKGTGKR